MTTRADAIESAGAVLAQARAERDALPARIAAERAYCPGGPSVDDIEQTIRRQRLDACLRYDSSVTNAMTTSPGTNHTS